MHVVIIRERTEEITNFNQSGISLKYSQAKSNPVDKMKTEAPLSKTNNISIFDVIPFVGLILTSGFAVGLFSLSGPEIKITPRTYHFFFSTYF